MLLLSVNLVSFEKILGDGVMRSLFYSIVVLLSLYEESAAQVNKSW